MVEVHPVTPGLVGVFSDILLEASRFLAERGQPMWDPETLVPAALLHAYRMEDLYLGTLSGEPPATLILQEKDAYSGRARRIPYSCISSPSVGPSPAPESRQIWWTGPRPKLTAAGAGICGSMPRRTARSSRLSTSARGFAACARPWWGDIQRFSGSGTRAEDSRI
ncbi:MAG: hypothetical protein ACP5QO_01910 [Clostridia bacterium]